MASNHQQAPPFIPSLEGLRRRTLSAEEARTFIEALVATVRQSIVILDEELHLVAANAHFFEHFGLEPEEADGKPIYDLGAGEWDVPELRQLLDEARREETIFRDHDVVCAVGALSDRTMTVNACQLPGMRLYILAIEDCTEHRTVARELQALTDDLEARVEARTEEVRRLAAELTRAEQAERERLAQFLHDDLQQQLYALQVLMQMSMASKVSEADANRLDGMLERAIDAVRDLSVELHPPLLQGEGLESGLAWIAERMKQRFELEVSLQARSPLPDLPNDTQSLILRAVQELLFNVVKHAGVDEAQVRYGSQGAEVVIEVVDEGRGAEVAKGGTTTSLGFGLDTLRDRMRLFGGEVEVKTEPGVGMHTLLRFPRP